jgi:hypothetical protein
MYSTAEYIPLYKRKSITKLFEEIDELSLLKHIFGDIRLGKLMKSPLREDKNPSFVFFYSKEKNRIMYHDFGTGESGNILMLYRKLYGNLDDLYKLYNTENSMDLYINNESITIAPVKQTTHIDIITRAFNGDDKIYWGQFGISLEKLVEYNVEAITHTITNGKIKYMGNELAYSYTIFCNKKIYRPFANKTQKWRSSTNRYDIPGWQQLKYNTDTLVITKSLKDVMALSSLNFDAIAPPSETTSLPSEVLTRISLQYKYIYVLFDNDETGIIKAKQYESKGFKTIFIPIESGCKDFTDYIKKYGIIKAKNMLQDLGLQVKA